ncbi:hypothetical protein LZ31DRAFT_143894 [Colletotrichum somersetense]|nr:hypothetical protein LZ31DRAFT_143894 [Colletotrichum somersetense]
MIPWHGLHSSGSRRTGGEPAHGVGHEHAGRRKLCGCYPSLNFNFFWPCQQQRGTCVDRWG